MSDEAVRRDDTRWEALDRAWEGMIQGKDPVAQDTVPEDDLELLRRLCDAGKLHQQRCSGQSSRMDEEPSISVATQSLGHLDQWSGTSLDDFQLIAPIAYGGMGIVYRARQISLTRLVA